MARFFLSFFFSLIIVFGLFSMMHAIIFQDKIEKNTIKTNNFIDFIRLKPKKQIQKRKEKKKVEKKEKQTPKRVAVASTHKIQQKIIKFPMPNIDLPNDFIKNNNLDGIKVAQQVGTEEFGVSQNKYSTDIMPIFTIPPEYPRAAKRRNIEGYVIVNFKIDTKGAVTDIIIQEAKPKGYFEKAAKQAISKWKFNPKLQNGKAVIQLAQQKLEFKLQ